ncbi:hypothetical protein AMATHDRAFT_77544 [Amanita thiersii Skay4041]|uniref:Pyridoxal phosphate-dependent transferase n=1 Tax=Amanita thiersii Skay4041 TaxID=703135 RepID=A0A2A9N8K3_9AGAR|nr:hypothetical protein AMATHDRAFT_77544 [Amanita thiersii Skay4041]
MHTEQFRKAIDRICDHYAALQEKPVIPKVEPGEDFQVISDDYQKHIIPGLTNWQHPSFSAFFPAACTFEGILADLYATSVCNPVFNWASSPACTELEVLLLGLSPACGIHQVLEVVPYRLFIYISPNMWMVLTLSTDYSFRFLHGHGCCRPRAKNEDLIIYTTTQIHSLGLESGRVLGLNVRAIEVKAEDKFALRGAALRSALEEDIKLGHHPFFFSDTSSGAIDKIPEIAQVVKDYPLLWVHVDAAWAGVTLCCPEYREMCYLNDINAIAMSFATNFHKVCLVRFMQLLCSGKLHLSLGRRFRSIKLWFVLRSFGAEAFRSFIRRVIDLNERFANLVAMSETLEIMTPPLPCILNGVVCIRLAVGSLFTVENHIDNALKILEEEGAIAIREWEEAK